MMIKRMILFLCALLIAVTAVGCGEKEQEMTAEEKYLRSLTAT